MALSIGVHKGDRIYVGDVPITVRHADGFERMEIEVGGRRVVVTDKYATEILKDVFVSCGRPGEKFIARYERLAADYAAGRRRKSPDRLLPRLIFEAPRSIVILREELYLAGRARNSLEPQHAKV
jgi:hypothetical protein